MGVKYSQPTHLQYLAAKSSKYPRISSDIHADFRGYKCIEHARAVHAISTKPATCMWQLQEGCAARGRGKPRVKPCIIKERNAIIIAIVVTMSLRELLKKNKRYFLIQFEEDKKFEVVGEEDLIVNNEKSVGQRNEVMYKKKYGVKIIKIG